MTPSGEPIDSFTNPEVQISGKIPGGDNLDNGIADTGATRAKISQANGKVALNVKHKLSFAAKQ